MDEVLTLCYEAEINIQNINYSILRESYDSLIFNEASDNDSAWKKFCDKVKEFFTKVLDAMKRMFAKILTLFGKMNRAGMASSVNGKMKDVLVPGYSLEDIMKWANNSVSDIFKLGEAKYPTFNEYCNANNIQFDKNITSAYGIEKKILDSYKMAITFVKQQKKNAETRYKYDLPKSLDNKSDPGKAELKRMFNIQQEAIRYIQKRTKAAVKYITTAIKRSYNPLIDYKKL